MSVLAGFEAHLPAPLRHQFQSLRKPIDIQRYLDSLPYIGEERDRCPLDVIKDRQCHCLDGGLLAALALRRIGDPGLLIDLTPARDAGGRKLDDDHVLAVFRRHGLWGAIAKSNYPWLRYREPIYRNLHELAISYFEVYYDVQGRKNLRGYTRPFDIARCDSMDYACDEGAAGVLYRRFYARKEIRLFPAVSEALFEPVEPPAYESGFLGVNWSWVYKPKE